jgi:hypothetical protein
LLCEPLETTANGKRLVVEDSAACQKTIQTPVAQQVLKTDGAGNLTWTNGASGTVLRKDSTGIVEFATLNSVLQAGPVDLGSQPLTTTGALTVGSLSPTLALTVSALTVSGATSTAAITSSSTILANGNSSKIGYNTGAGGTITQGAGAKTNSVTLNRPTGIIVTDSAALAANTAVAFNLSNSVIEATDIVVVSHISGGSLSAYNFAVAPAAGNANIVIRNIAGGSLSEALTLRFIVIKSVNA